MLKRVHKSTFHETGPKHMERYVTEFTGRHKIRDHDTIKQMQGVAAPMNGKRLKYSDFVA